MSKSCGIEMSEAAPRPSAADKGTHEGLCSGSARRSNSVDISGMSNRVTNAIAIRKARETLMKVLYPASSTSFAIDSSSSFSGDRLTYSQLRATYLERGEVCDLFVSADEHIMIRMQLN